MSDPGARVLIYDIETAPNRGWYYDRYRENNIIRGEADWYILCFAYKWLGERQTHVVSLPDFDLYQADPENDLEVVRALHGVFSQADVTITHNGKAFDNKKANSRFAVHKLGPAPPRKEIDTLLVARKQFGFTSNSLGDLCRVLGLTPKGDPGTGTWKRCIDGDPAAWKRMTNYNKLDVKILEELYLRFRPWVPNHPNLNIYGDRPDVCPVCQRRAKFHARGFYPLGVTKRRKFHCQSCGSFIKGREIITSDIEYVA